jgi:3-hydroxyisobutyrate dehydrogenase-like beta-hydroxyacid dehydrogenase
MNSSLWPTPVAFVGIGLMGLAMALRLRDAGQAVRVCDIDPARTALAAAAGCNLAPSPAAVAAGCTLLLVAVVDAAQAETVLFGPQGAVAALPAGATVVLCPTIAPADAERLAARLAAAGLGCIDAPMSGGPARARDGSMSLMVACEDALFERHQAELQQLSSRLFRVGRRCGDGARTKLVNNLLAAANLAAASEAAALAEHLGLDPRRTLAVIEQSSGQSWIGTDRLSRVLAGDTAEPRARMALLAKDSALAMAMAAEAGVVPAVGERAAALFRAACDAGLTDEDDSRLFSLLQAQIRARHSNPTA